MCWLLAACLFAADPAWVWQGMFDPAETVKERQARHAEVARKRTGVIVLVDGGATEFGPSHSLRAIRAATQLGASGVRLTVRSTFWGLVVFPDSSSLRLLDSVDPIASLVGQYYFPPNAEAKGDPCEIGLACFEASLALSRRSALLLDLELESPTLTKDVVAILRKEDMLDHVVRIRGGDIGQIAAAENAGLGMLPLVENPNLFVDDCERAVVSTVLNRSGVAFVIGDPRLSLSLQHRTPTRVTLDHGVPAPRLIPHFFIPPLQYIMESELNRRGERVPADWREPRRYNVFAAGMSGHAWKTNPEIRWHDEDLTPDFKKDLSDPDRGVRSEAILASARIGADYWQSTAKKELRRFDEELNAAKVKPADVVSILGAKGRIALALSLTQGDAEGDALLIAMVSRPTLTDDPMWAGVDAAAAARALGRRKATTAVSSLREALLQPIAHAEKDATKLDADQIGRTRIARESAIALSKVGGNEALLALESAMNLPPEERAKRPKELASIAASALSRFDVPDRAPILAKLIVHGLPEVRREGVLGALRESGPQYRTLLELSTDWAVPWWDVQHRPN